VYAGRVRDRERHWFELELELQPGGRAWARGRASTGAESGWETLDAARLELFAERLKRAVEEKARVDGLRSEAEALYAMLFQESVSRVWERLSGEAGSQPVLLEFKTKGLRAVPFEALCLPGPSGDHLGLLAQVGPVRSAAVVPGWEPREVEGAVRVLAVAPQLAAWLEPNKVALGDSLKNGEVEWLEPAVTGKQARRASLLDRLATVKGDAHVLLFVGCRRQ
jgi:hypothetical protein